MEHFFRHWFYRTSFNIFYCGVCSISGLAFVLCYFHCYPILVCLFSFIRFVCSSLSSSLAVLHVRAFFVLSSSGLCCPFHVGFLCCCFKILWKSIILTLFVSGNRLDVLGFPVLAYSRLTQEPNLTTPKPKPSQALMFLMRARAQAVEPQITKP